MHGRGEGSGGVVRQICRGEGRPRGLRCSSGRREGKRQKRGRDKGEGGGGGGYECKMSEDEKQLKTRSS